MSYKNIEDKKKYDEQYRLNHKEEIAKKNKKYYINNKEKELKRMKQRYLCKGKEEQFISKYGLSYNEWEGLWYAQDGRCAICDKFFVEMKDIYVDHNHKTGKTRGLLCHNCNSGIGFLNDDPELTMKATEYLIGE